MKGSRESTGCAQGPSRGLPGAVLHAVAPPEAVEPGRPAPYSSHGNCHPPRADPEAVMIKVSVGIAVLLATTTPVATMAQSPAEQPQNPPPTAIDREENNPAKTAAKV